MAHQKISWPTKKCFLVGPIFCCLLFRYFGFRFSSNSWNTFVNENLPLIRSIFLSFTSANIVGNRSIPSLCKLPWIENEMCVMLFIEDIQRHSTANFLNYRSSVQSAQWDFFMNTNKLWQAEQKQRAPLLSVWIISVTAVFLEVSVDRSVRLTPPVLCPDRLIIGRQQLEPTQ